MSYYCVVNRTLSEAVTVLPWSKTPDELIEALRYPWEHFTSDISAALRHWSLEGCELGVLQFPDETAFREGRSLLERGGTLGQMNLERVRLQPSQRRSVADHEEVLTDLDRGISQRKVAEKHGISRALVQKIVATHRRSLD